MWGENCITSAKVCVNISPLSLSLSALQEAMQISRRVSGGVFRKYIFLSINIRRKPNLDGKNTYAMVHLTIADKHTHTSKAHASCRQSSMEQTMSATSPWYSGCAAASCFSTLVAGGGWGQSGRKRRTSLKSDGCRRKKAPQVLCAAAGKKVLCSWISTHCRGWQVCYVVWNKWFWIQQWWHTLPSVYLLADLKQHTTNPWHMWHQHIAASCGAGVSP